MFGFFADPAMTTPITALSLVSLFDGTASTPVAEVVYFGNPTAGSSISPESGAAILVSVTDAASGSGLPASAVKLASSEAGLATATGGAALSLGASMTSGAGNQVAVWIEIDAGAAAVGDYTDLGLTTNSLVEVAA